MKDFSRIGSEFYTIYYNSLKNNNLNYSVKEKKYL